jgi:hypothetical protein
MAIDFELYEDDIKKVKLIDTQSYKARNILSVQKGSLNYDAEAGVDRDYFINNDKKFKRNSFFAYLVQELIFQNIAVTDYVVDLTKDFIQNLQINLQSSVNDKDVGGMF